MTFAQQVKDELISFDQKAREAGTERVCCHHAEQYGLFLFSRMFGCNEIGIKTERKAVAGMYADAAGEICGKRPKVQKSDAGNYRVDIESIKDRNAILAAFGYSGHEVSRRLNRANLEYDCCNAALLRGAFLACGTVTDPKKDYHLEFVLSHKVLCNDFMKLMSELDLSPKYVLRGGAHIIYFKESESIEDVLTLMGATECSMALMQEKIYKNMRNRVNRRVNFENANSSRAFNAAYREIEAIRFIDERTGLGSLPEDLRELALLRLDNADYSLSDLAENLKEPISKSGVNHRMKRLLQMADELASEERKETDKTARKEAL